MRVLHVVESIDYQAVESWLLQVLNIAKDKYPGIHWTFFCSLSKPGEREHVARQLGATVLRSPFELRTPLRYLASLHQIMKQGRYDVLHCHHDIMSALPLLASYGLPFRRRIVHVHNTSISLPTPHAIKATVMRFPLRNICLRADRIVGVSRDALAAMLGGQPPRPSRDTVVHCGIDLRPFERDEAAAARLRMSFSFGDDAKVLLFVGRMIPYKNPGFVVELLESLCQRDARFAAVFAGKGPLEDRVLEQARTKGLEHRVRVLGWRRDVPLLMHASDILVWPGVENPKEGLGLTVVEAQAAGLPVLMSRNVPAEAVVLPELVEILPLDSGTQAWSAAVIELLARVRPDPAQALRRINESSFTIASSAENLVALYS